ncbi:MAG: tRNA (adenosine(37)-N6)-threonylcarbamoyltransferase complex transferase subunit TsaD [Clostridia bacterium]
MMDIHILAIETSCDETACAVVRNGREVLSNVIWSQAALFEKYGGVVPEIASRKHMEYIIPTLKKALEGAGVSLEGMDAIAVTSGPGLVGALLVGVSMAKGLAFALGKPLLGVNHLEGHIAANYIAHRELDPPFICLLVSGGHSHILHVREHTAWEVMGRTRDDAAGEAYDKTARALGLGYPGGPAVDRMAASGNPDAIRLPRTRFGDNPYDFSFSGLKTAVLNHINTKKQNGETIHVPDVCASFQKTVVDTLVENTIRAARDRGAGVIVLAGGVAANSSLRREMADTCRQQGLSLYYPPPDLCTDNAAMIASAAHFRFIKGDRDDYTLNARSTLRL